VEGSWQDLNLLTQRRERPADLPSNQFGCKQSSIVTVIVVSLFIRSA
jgi:hypothetical protein